jgi:uncharacterized protein (TIGR03067 family)
MDGTWKATTVEITAGKKAFECSVSDVGMVIKDGVGTWSDGKHRGTVKVDLSGFTSAAPGFASAPIDFVHTGGPGKGLTWQGICSRCGNAAIVCVSPKGRPEQFKGDEALPVIIFRYQRREE